MSPQDEARDPATAGARLRELAKVPHCLPLVAGNPAAPPDLLKQLAAVSKLDVLTIIVANPNTPFKVLLHLAARLPTQFLKNPILPLLLLENPSVFGQMSAELREETVFALLRVPTLPRALARIFAYHVVPSVSVAAQLHITLMGEWPPKEWEARTARIFQAGSMRFSQITLWSNYAAIPGLLPSWFVGWLMHHSDADAQVILACAADLSHAQFAVMAHHPHDRVRVRLAQNPHLPADLMLALAQDAVAEVRLHLARHPALTETAMMVLATDADMPVRQHLARHPSLSAFVLAAMLRDASWEVRQMIREREDMPPERYAALLQGSTLGQWYASAIDPATTGETLAALSVICKGAPEVLCAIARNPHAPRDLLHALALHDLPLVRAAVAARPRYTVSKAELEFFRAQPDDKGLRFLAMHPKTPKRLIAVLAQHADAEIRWGVAMNPGVNYMHLIHFENDPSGAVRLAVAQHPEAGWDILDRLIHDPERAVRDAVVRHPKYEPSLKELRFRSLTMSQEEQERFLAILATLPLTQVESLADTHIEAHTRLLTHLELDETRKSGRLKRLVQFSVQHYGSDTFFPLLASPLLAEESLRRFATDPQWWTRLMVARNPKTPPSVLKALAEDGIVPVRAAAQAAMTLHKLKRRRKAPARAQVPSCDGNDAAPHDQEWR